MKAPQPANDTFIITSQIGECSAPNEFIVEFFPFTSEITSHEKPIKVIHNFDELIEFFELDLRM